MSRDLVTNHLKPGMTRAEVQDLLDKPDEVISTNRDNGGNLLLGVETFSYYIGCWSGYHGHRIKFSTSIRASVVSGK